MRGGGLRARGQPAGRNRRGHRGPVPGDLQPLRVHVHVPGDPASAAALRGGAVRAGQARRQPAHHGHRPGAGAVPPALRGARDHGRGGRGRRRGAGHPGYPGPGPDLPGAGESAVQRPEVHREGGPQRPQGAVRVLRLEDPEGLLRARQAGHPHLGHLIGQPRWISTTPWRSSSPASARPTWPASPAPGADSTSSARWWSCTAARSATPTPTTATNSTFVLPYEHA